MNKTVVAVITVGVVAAVAYGCYLTNNIANRTKFVHDICLSAGGIYSEEGNTYFTCYNRDAVQSGMWHKSQIETAMADAARYKKIKELSR